MVTFGLLIGSSNDAALMADLGLLSGSISTTCSSLFSVRSSLRAASMRMASEYDGTKAQLPRMAAKSSKLSTVEA